MSNDKILLIGKTVTEMKIAEDKQALLFVTTDGEFIAHCDADCCSYTWIESVELPALGFPFEILEIIDLDMPEVEYDHEEHDVLAFYGVKIATNKGDMVIDYRNDSNGYYGGNIVWPMDEGEYNYFYGGVYGQNVSKEEWVDIEDAG